jgi:2-dehydropantoate 2-reductase
MKVYVVGAGAMGCLYAAAFHRAGDEVVLVDVSPAQVEAINANGLDLETRAGREVLPIPARLPQEASGTAELILLFTRCSTPTRRSKARSI